MKDIDPLITQTCLEMLLDKRESLDSVLDRYPEQRDDLKPVLEAALWLREVRQTIHIRPGFLETSRIRIVNVIRKSNRGARIALAPGALVFSQVPIYLGQDQTISSWVVAAASLVMLLCTIRRTPFPIQRSICLPGDRLYSLKTFFENAVLAIAPGWGFQAKLHVQFARRRLQEFTALVPAGYCDQVQALLEVFDLHAGQAILKVIRYSLLNEQGAIEIGIRLEDLLLEQQAALIEFESKLPFEALPFLRQSLLQSARQLTNLRRGLAPLETVRPTGNS